MSRTARPSRPAGRWGLRLARPLVAVGVLGMTALVSWPPGAPALGSLGPAVAGAPPPAGAAPCPVTTYPPGHPYQLAVSGSLVGQLVLRRTPAGPVSLPAITGSFCGLLQLPSERAIVQPDNIHFTPISASLARATIPAGVLTTGPGIGTVAPRTAPDGGLDLVLEVPAAATAGLLGLRCVLPAPLALSTLGPGGLPLTGPLADASATVTQTGFAVQPAESTGATGTCPSYVAAQVDTLLGLPNTSTATTVHLTLDISLQQ